jgi:hypothetical protein
VSSEWDERLGGVQPIVWFLITGMFIVAFSL